MIMLKKPLKLKSLSGITFNDAFSEKIRANYEFMTAAISKEELLHLLLDEPAQTEQRSAVTILVENVAAVNKNEIMIKLLNQVLNRILMMGESKAVYQDQVYISCVLRKLGITDINTFLQRIKKSREEYALKYQLLKKYKSENEILVEIREEEAQNCLYEEIMRRLHTMEIYQSVSQWNYMQGIGQKILFHNELALSEQQENVLNMRLVQEKRKLIYPHCQMDFMSSNLYEAELPKNRPDTREKIFAHLLEASVFYLAKSVSLAGIFRQNSGKKGNCWYDIGFEICRLIKNTLNRCQWQYQNFRPLNVNDIQSFFEWQSKLYRYELHVLQEITESEADRKEQLIYAAEKKDREVENTLKEDWLEEKQKESTKKETEKILTEKLQQKEIHEKIQKETIQAEEIQQIFHEIESELLYDTKKAVKNLQRTKSDSPKPKAELIYRQTRQDMPESENFNENTNKTTTVTKKIISQNKIKLSNLPAIVQNQTKTDTKQINEVIQVIQSNIQKQINQITDQVYQKIEKKLQNERRRRGL